MSQDGLVTSKISKAKEVLEMAHQVACSNFENKTEWGYQGMLTFKNLIHLNKFYKFVLKEFILYYSIIGCFKYLIHIYCFV